MRLSTIILPVAVFVIAAAASVLVASFSANVIEDRSKSAVKTALIISGDDWAKVDVDGLQVSLTGTALSEASRFHALSAARSVVDAARVIDNIEVADAASIAPPTFSIEILRNNDGISLIGLVPASTDREAVATEISELAQGAKVTDMLDTADFPAPKGWKSALDFGMEALRRLPKSKISIAANHVAITAISESTTQRRQIEETLARKAPEGLKVDMQVSAPRPVITPFTLRFLIDDQGARFDACAADSEVSKQKILEAAKAAGVDTGSNCTIGLGVPSPNWGEAVATAIKALKELGGGSLTFSDADVSLVALDSVPQKTFDRVTGQLEADLPKVFSLHAVLPEPVKINGTGKDTSDGPPEFVATRSPEGQVQLRGRLTDDRLRAAVNSFARARFGMKNVASATRLDDNLPDGWSVRVLAALESLSLMNNGSVVVQPAFVELRGTTGDPEAKATVSRILSEKLGNGANFKIDITYQKRLDPVANLPTPEECVKSINAVLAANKITFSPSSSTIEPSANKTLDRIAALLKNCENVKMEIGGHTDSQGREEMNQSLSQARAEAVLTALMARRVLTSGLEAKGYGESQPIADNKTEQGREANRRIEFKLVVPEKPVETQTTLEAVEDAASTAGNSPQADTHEKPAEAQHEQN